MWASYVLNRKIVGVFNPNKTSLLFAFASCCHKCFATKCTPQAKKKKLPALLPNHLNDWPNYRNFKFTCFAGHPYKIDDKFFSFQHFVAPQTSRTAKMWFNPWHLLSKGALCCILICTRLNLEWITFELYGRAGKLIYDAL